MSCVQAAINTAASVTTGPGVEDEEEGEEPEEEEDDEDMAEPAPSLPERVEIVSEPGTSVALRLPNCCDCIYDIVKTDYTLESMFWKHHFFACPSLLLCVYVCAGVCRLTRSCLCLRA